MRKIVKRGDAPIGATGRVAEAKLAQRVGGKVTMGSGALLGDKGDIKTARGLLEVKATEGDRYTLKLSELAKISREAAMRGRKPAFAVLFVDAKGEPVSYGAWVLVPETEYRAMTEKEDGN